MQRWRTIPTPQGYAASSGRGAHMPEQTPSPTFSAAMSAAAATALNSRTGRTIAALFVIFQIYLVGVTPAWIGTLEVQKMIAELEIARQEAAAATQRQASEA